MRAATLGNRLKVMIVGAGTGGLCLAQGLKADGIAVEVFERDYSPTDRLQGYRLGVSETGRRALRECLPKALFDKLVASCANPSRAVTFLDHRLNRLLNIELGANEQNDLPVSRISLRGILLEGLDEIVCFGKKFIAFRRGSLKRGHSAFRRRIDCNRRCVDRRGWCELAGAPATAAACRASRDRYPRRLGQDRHDRSRAAGNAAGVPARPDARSWSQGPFHVRQRRGVRKFR